MDILKETKVILAEIEKSRKLYNLDKYIIVKINHEEETDSKSYEFLFMFNDSSESVEATFNLNTLNQVLKVLLNEDYVVNFDYEKY